MGQNTNSLLECCPLRDHNAVLQWNGSSSPDWSGLVEPLRPRTSFTLPGYPICRADFSPRPGPCPRTLVCHDMKGGYLNDRFVEGHENLKDYKFANWPCIDTFVYFSHHFLTIPPLAWINAGHLHGVKVLGTIITEGKEGEAVWSEVLGDKRLAKRLALNLAWISKHYGFEGYLLNVENRLNLDLIQPFISFVKELRSALKNTSPHSELIWYDAVTCDGELKWQNSLNDKNKMFFDVCDGIYLNYNWDKEKLASSVKAAGERSCDVYVGIDVFGRGCPGGGGFSTSEAFDMVRKASLSGAIFAPGWTHEACGEEEDTEERDYRFWSSISQYLFTHGPTQLPFKTSFCRGYGTKLYKNGLTESKGSWLNQREMVQQAAQISGVHGLTKDSCFMHYTEDGFQGGGCLLLRPSNSLDKPHSDCLLVCCFTIPPKNIAIIRLVFKPLLETVGCEIDLIVITGNTSDVEAENKLKRNSFSIDMDKCSKVNSWFQSEFKLPISSEDILGVCCQLSGMQNPILIGLLSIEAEPITVDKIH